MKYRPKSLIFFFEKHRLNIFHSLFIIFHYFLKSFHYFPQSFHYLLSIFYFFCVSHTLRLYCFFPPPSYSLSNFLQHTSIQYLILSYLPLSLISQLYLFLACLLFLSHINFPFFYSCLCLLYNFLFLSCFSF